MAYTVKQLADLAGVSSRTLRYYDSIGLLKPSSYGESGYRLYDDSSLRRLQQILFLKELDFRLDDIASILDDPEFDEVVALKEHRKLLVERMQATQRLIETIDKTVHNVTEGTPMTDKEYFAGFEEHKRYRQEAIERYGQDAVEESEKRVGKLSKDQWQALSQEFSDIVHTIMQHMNDDPSTPQVQEQVARLHKWLGNYYECDLDRLLGVVRTYGEHPDFRAMFEKNYSEDVPDYLLKATEIYCRNQ